MESETDRWTEALSQYFTDKNWELVPVAGGLNNLTKLVKTPTDTYVMRIYQNGYGIEKIQYECETLNKLQSLKFSFQTPKIFKTLKGEDYAHTESGIQAIMFYFIDGIPPDENIPAHTKEFGRVSGELIAGWKDLKIEQVSPTFPYHKIYKIIPAVPDQETLLKAMADPVFSDVESIVNFLREEILQLEEAVNVYHSTLPQQNFHGDLWIGNCLIKDDKITAILDFEFASIDWRALEVAICVSRYPSSADPWTGFVNYLSGFKGNCWLNEEEVKAIPSLMKLRILTNIIHFIGRWLEGLDSVDDLKNRFRTYFKRISWINENSHAIVKLCSEYILAQ